MYLHIATSNEVLPWHGTRQEGVEYYKRALTFRPIRVYKLPQRINGCKFLIFEGHHRRRAAEEGRICINLEVMQGAKDFPFLITEEEYKQRIRNALTYRERAIREGRLK